VVHECVVAGGKNKGYCCGEDIKAKYKTVFLRCSREVIADHDLNGDLRNEGQNRGDQMGEYIQCFIMEKGP
jgi:hypothetical protein